MTQRTRGYKSGTPFTSALMDAWCRDLEYDQVQSELEDIGYFVDAVFIGLFYENMNRQMEMDRHGKEKVEAQPSNI